jgi:hypothetical protein
LIVADPYPCTVALCEKLPSGALPCSFWSVIERAGEPVALTLVFDPRIENPNIVEGETVAYVDSKGRLLELTTARGLAAPDHIIQQAREQDRWIVLTVPIRIVAWKKRRES